MSRSDSDGSVVFSSQPPSPTSVRSRGSSVPTTVTFAASDTQLIPPQQQQQHNVGEDATPQTSPVGSSRLASIFENRQANDVEGWPLLAKLMTKEPDFEAFDRFEELNVKNLLYYQVELALIKRRLEKWERDDRNNLSDENRSKFYTMANKLVGSDTSQWRNVLKMRECLNGYNNALLQFSQVSALPEPSRRNMKVLVRWLASPDAANFKVAGIGNGAWGDQYASGAAGPKEPGLAHRFFSLLLSIVKPRAETPTQPNLVAPRGQRSVDGLTRWIIEEAIPFWEALKEAVKARWEKKKKDASGEEEKGQGSLPDRVERDVEIPVEYSSVVALSEKDDRNADMKALKPGYIQSYSGHSILKLTTKLATLFACMLPMVAIGVLSAVDNLSHRLGLIAAFTAIFCSGLMAVAEVTRVQVFTATSAFLAVLVVFVQSQ